MTQQQASDSLASTTTVTVFVTQFRTYPSLVPYRRTTSVAAINTSSLLARLSVLSTNTRLSASGTYMMPIPSATFFLLADKKARATRALQTATKYLRVHIGSWKDQTLSWSTWRRRKQAHIRHLPEDPKRDLESKHRRYKRHTYLMVDQKMFCLWHSSASWSLENRHRFNRILRQPSCNLLRHAFFFHRVNDTWQLFSWCHAQQIFLSSSSIPIKSVSNCCGLTLALPSSRW